MTAMFPSEDLCPLLEDTVRRFSTLYLLCCFGGRSLPDLLLPSGVSVLWVLRRAMGEALCRAASDGRRVVKGLNSEGGWGER